MIGKTKERWMELCELATTEHNPKKMVELVREINELLEAKESRLKPKPPSPSANEADRA
jgi:hypothetical protein